MRRGSRRPRVLGLGVAGLFVAVVAVGLAPTSGPGSSVVLFGNHGMPRRHADFHPLESTGPGLEPAAVLAALTGLAQGRRLEWTGTVVALVQGLGVQLFTGGLAPVALLGEVVATVLVAAALVLTRWSPARG